MTRPRRRQTDAYASNFFAGGPGGGGGLVLGASPRDWSAIPIDPQSVQSPISCGPAGATNTYFQEFIFRQTMTFNKMTVYNSLAGGAGNFTAVGIYQIDNNGKLKKLLAEAIFNWAAGALGAVTSPLTTGPVTITPNIYAIAMATNAAGGTVVMYGASYVSQVGLAWTKNQPYAGFVNIPLSGGHLAPDLSAGIYTTNTTVVPFINLEP